MLTDKAVREGDAEMHKRALEAEAAKELKSANDAAKAGAKAAAKAARSAKSAKAARLKLRVGRSRGVGPTPSPLLRDHQGFSVLARMKGPAQLSRDRERLVRENVRCCMYA